MPITINGVEMMTDDGKFTENFSPAIAGDAYKDRKDFTDGRSPDLPTLVKGYLDGQTSISKHAAKMENVIQRPGNNATEDEKAEFHKILLKELGAPEKVEDYDLAPPEGMQHDETLIAEAKNWFLEIGLPPSMAKVLVDRWDSYAAAKMKEAKDADNAAFENEAKTFKSEHPGDKLTLDTRIAAKAMIQFGGEETAKAIKEGGLLTENKTGDLDVWKEKLGIWPRQLAAYAKIGAAMKSDEAITNEGEPISSTGPAKGSKEEKIAKVYDHPTSQADRKARGVAY